MLHPVGSNDIVEEIIGQIEEAIMTGHFSSGDKLPPERELEKVLKTSRTTIRIALRVLEQKGLISIKPGRQGGAFVSDLSLTDKIGEHFALLMKMGSVSLSQITTFRFAIDTSAFLLAVQNCTKKDVVELKKILNDMQEQLSHNNTPDWREFFAIESLLHQKVIVMAKNPLFELVLKLIHTNLWDYYSILPKEREYLVKICRDWKDMISAMDAHDVFRADALIKAHLVESHRELIRTMEENDLNGSDVLKIFYESSKNGNEKNKYPIRDPL